LLTVIVAVVLVVNACCKNVCVPLTVLIVTVEVVIVICIIDIVIVIAAGVAVRQVKDDNISILFLR